MKVYFADMARVNELEKKWPDVDWFAILTDGGINAVKSTQNLLKSDNSQRAAQAA